MDRAKTKDPSGNPVERFRRARGDRSLAVLEGFHPLKHALRFGAEILEVALADTSALKRQARSLAPDVLEGWPELFSAAEAGPGASRRPRRSVIARDLLDRLAPRPPGAVIAIARRPAERTSEAVSDPSSAPLVLLEKPTHLGNVGAVVRVAAAAGAAGVLTTGEHDPWHPAALRGGAGLQFALPVGTVDGLPASDRPLAAIDPEGEPLRPGVLPPRAILAFGSERRGLGPELLDRADVRVGIPMRPGVSSLNLATAVAILLYAP